MKHTMTAQIRATKGAIVATTVSDQTDPQFMNAIRVGRRVKSARVDAGYSRSGCLAAVRKLGYNMPDWAIGAIERGDRLPDAAEIAALTLLLAPPAGLHFFLLPAMPAALAKRFAGMNCGD